MTRKIVAGNWKMNNTVGESLKLITGIVNKTENDTTVEIVVIPPFTALSSVNIVLVDSAVKLGAQNLHWETLGAYTGEVSGLFLKDVGCTYVLVGHSERRQFFGDTNEGCNKKLKAALACELSPIFCIGESLAEREEDRTEEVLETQIKAGLVGLSIKDIVSITIAYEPVWAIGTGKTATIGQIGETHYFIYNLLAKMYDGPTANAVRILYGGSVKADNAKSIMAVKHVDGALVGGASLDADGFAKIVKAAL